MLLRCQKLFSEELLVAHPNRGSKRGHALTVGDRLQMGAGRPAGAFALAQGQALIAPSLCCRVHLLLSPSPGYDARQRLARETGLPAASQTLQLPAVPCQAHDSPLIAASMRMPIICLAADAPGAAINTKTARKAAACLKIFWHFCSLICSLHTNSFSMRSLEHTILSSWRQYSCQSEDLHWL